MTQEERENLRVFHALDHEKRLSILAYLADYGESDYDTMYKYFDSPRLHLSHHLTVLIKANLIDVVWTKPVERYKLSEKSLKLIEKYSEFNKKGEE